MGLFTSRRKSFKSLDNFATKRFAVVSINKALILATFLAPFWVVLYNIFLRDMEFSPNGMVWIVLIFSACVLVITNFLNINLTNQILLLNKEIFNSRDFLTDFEKKRFGLFQRMRENFLNNSVPHPLAYLVVFILFLILLYIFINL